MKITKLVPSNTLSSTPSSTSGDSYYLAPEKLLQGNPLQTVWMDYTDPSQQFLVGIWRSEPGKWKVTYTEEEYCCMLEGRSILTPDGGPGVTMQAGDSFVVPRGFVGTWEVVTASTKRFVIYESVDAKKFD